MSTLHTQHKSLFQLVSIKTKEKPLVENTVLPDTKAKNIAHPFIFKSIPLPELVQRHSVLVLFQTNFVHSQCKAFAQFYNSSEMKKGSSYKRL